MAILKSGQQAPDKMAIQAEEVSPVTKFNI